MPRHNPPLAELGAFFEKVISRDQIEELGWGSAGGALATVINGFAAPWMAQIPLVDKLPPAVHRAVLGVIEGRLAYESPMGGREMACGIAGATVGREVGLWIADMLGVAGGLSDYGQLPEEEELAQIPYDDRAMGQALPSDQLGPTSDALRIQRGQLAEVVPIEFGSGLAALGAQAVDVQELGGVGTWMTG